MSDNIFQCQTKLFNAMHFCPCRIGNNIQSLTKLFNVIKYYSMSCNIIQCHAILFNVMQYYSISDIIVQCHALWSRIGNNIQCPTKLFNVIKYNSMSCNITKCHAILLNVRQYYSMTINIIQCQAMSALAFTTISTILFMFYKNFFSSHGRTRKIMLTQVLCIGPSGLSNLRVSVPSIVLRGETTKFNCSWDQDPRDKVII